MSHLALVALAALTAALACASPTPPEPTTPESGAASTEPSSSPALDPSAAAATPDGVPVEATLFVREQRVDCQGEAARRCLQVRESESDPWRNLYATIEGFDYEESNAYQLRVEVTQASSPPADAASLRYRLLEVVYKRKVAPPAASK